MDDHRSRLDLVEGLLTEIESGLDGSAPLDIALLDDIRYQLDWVLTVADRSSFDWMWAQYLSAGWFRCQGRAQEDPACVDEAIAALRMVIGHTDIPGFRIELVDLIQLRYRVTDTDDRRYLTESISELRELEAQELDDDDRGVVDALLGMSLREEFRRERVDGGTAPPELLDKAQTYLDRSLDAVGVDDEVRMNAMLDLARLRSFRSMMDGTPYVRDVALEKAEAIPLYEQVAPRDPNAAYELADMMVSQFQATGEVRLRNGALRWLNKIEGDPRLDVSPADFAELRGELLLDRARRDPAELPELIAYLTEAFAAEPVPESLGTMLLTAHYMNNDPDGMLRTVDRLATVPDARIVQASDLLKHRALALAGQALRDHTGLSEAERVVREATREPAISGWTKRLLIALLAVVRVVRTRPGVAVGELADVPMWEGLPAEETAELLAWLEAHELPGADWAAAVAVLRSTLSDGLDSRLAALDAIETALQTLTEQGELGDVYLVLLFLQVAESFSVGRQLNDLRRMRTTLALVDEFFDRATSAHPLWSSALGLYGAVMSDIQVQGGEAPPCLHAVAALAEACADEENDPEARAAFLVLLARAELLQSLQERVDLYDSAIGHCRQAMELVPPGTDEHDEAWLMLGVLLMTRFQDYGARHDVEAGVRHLTDLRASRAARGADVSDIDETLLRSRAVTGAKDILAAAGGWPDSDAELDPPSAAADQLGRAFARLSAAVSADDEPKLMQALDLLASAVEATERSSVTFPVFALVGEMARIAVAVLRRDWTMFEIAITRLEALRDDESVPGTDRDGAIVGMVMGWHGRHSSTRTTADLDEALRNYAHLNLATFGARDITGLLDGLADSCWKLSSLGYAADAISIGFDSLRHRARDVLLQGGGEHAVGRATDAAGRAQRVALRCAASKELERAVEAVEWGRGLVLHSATVTAGLGARLRALGHDQLAEEWCTQPDEPVAGTPFDFVPSTLRRRVLSALGDDLEMLSPPSVADIAKALRALEADVLVHLVPGQEKHTGRALLTSARGTVREVLLPLLTDDPDSTVGRYLAMDDQRRRTELPSLCRWAWRAVVQPVLDAVGGEQPWLVLVPTGALGVVPWHAATGSDRLAVREAGFGYAVSARQLCDVAHRRRLPVGETPVIVSDPSSSLAAAQYETEFLRGCYPHARCYGQAGSGVPVDGAGTPDEVLTAGATASLLHLGCHAEAGPTPARSALKLARADLSVERMLRHAAGRPDDAAGGLVVLAACESDLTEGLHDEALTLAAAYVAAGATGVVGTKWKVDDTRSALLMCVFYDFLARRGMRPRDALRATQLWALDENRAVPDGVGTHLSSHAQGPAVAEPVYWAAFACHGW